MMNSWKASLVIFLLSWKVSAWLGWKTRGALSGECVGPCAPGSALPGPCLAAPGQLRQSGTACLGPLLLLFSSLRDLTGSFWDGHCSQWKQRGSQL